MSALADIETLGLVAVVRASSARAAEAASRALADGGVRAIEVTFTVPDAADAIRALAGDADLVVGAGTVMTPAQVREAAAAGARYLVAPNFDPAVADAADEVGLPLLPGVLTATEVEIARRRCEILKLFPSGLGGPAYLSALRGPFPDLRVIPTGAVPVEAVAGWFAAGVVAIGAGSDLCPPAAADAFDADDLRARAQRWVAAVADARR